MRNEYELWSHSSVNRKWVSWWDATWHRGPCLWMALKAGKFYTSRWSFWLVVDLSRVAEAKVARLSQVDNGSLTVSIHCRPISLQNNNDQSGLESGGACSSVPRVTLALSVPPCQCRVVKSQWHLAELLQLCLFSVLSDGFWWDFP